MPNRSPKPKPSQVRPTYPLIPKLERDWPVTVPYDLAPRWLGLGLVTLTLTLTLTLTVTLTLTLTLTVTLTRWMSPGAYNLLTAAFTLGLAAAGLLSAVVLSSVVTLSVVPSLSMTPTIMPRGVLPNAP